MPAKTRDHHHIKFNFNINNSKNFHKLKKPQFSQNIYKKGNFDLDSCILVISIDEYGKESLFHYMKPYQKYVPNSTCYISKIRDMKANYMKNSTETKNKFMFQNERMRRSDSSLKITSLNHQERLSVQRFDKISVLDVRKSIRLDDKHPYVFHNSVFSKCKILACSFEKKSSGGTRPKTWNMMPKSKKNYKVETSNYRSVSVDCKVMKKGIEQFRSKNVLTRQHIGLIKDKSCITNVMENIDILITDTSKGESFDLLIITYSPSKDCPLSCLNSMFSTWLKTLNFFVKS
jgi:hypothetical protein